LSVLDAGLINRVTRITGRGAIGMRGTVIRIKKNKT
jgi:hypothetical protein